jgi:hypothetical protein
VLGQIVEAQIFLNLDVYAPGSPYAERNVPHYGSSLRGGIVGDFLTHMAYLTLGFVGPVGEVRTSWRKHKENSPLAADEFRALVKGDRATAHLAFSGNAQPDGFWVRVVGTQAQAEANLFEPPRLTSKRRRSGEPAAAKLLDGIAEARAVLRSTVAGFWRKLGGTSSYDGLSEAIAQTYVALEMGADPPVSIDEVDETVRLVDRLTADEFRL